MSQDNLYTILILVNLAAVDHNISDFEKSWINALVRKYSFSDAQIERINEEFLNPSLNHIEFFKLIESRLNREKVLDLVRYLISSDNELHAGEVSTFKKLSQINDELNSKFKSEVNIIAKSIAQETKDLEFFRELADFGKTLNQKKGWFLNVLWDLGGGGRFARRCLLILVIGFIVFLFLRQKFIFNAQ
jgi:hypothetical protein